MLDERMAYLSLVCALAGLGAALVAGAAQYVALGLGVFAVGAGTWSWRRGERSGLRLAAAAAIAIGLLALVLAVARIGLTIVALERLRRLFQ